MAILNNFEVTILSPQYRISNPLDGTSTTIWQPINEHDPLHLKDTDQTLSSSSQKYIGITPTNSLDQDHHYEFAIDFKAHCGFNFIDGDAAEYIVFRTYLDDVKIGSAFVKRERWERSGTYRVRKKGRRYWVDELQSWVQKPWEFDSGLHGTLKIEVWRECSRPASSGSWDHPDFFGEGNIYDSGNAIALNEFDGGLPKMPRVRHTKKVDLWPMATFVYDYRSEDTLRILGMANKSALTPAPMIDLTTEDSEPPSSALTSTNESDAFWSNIDSSNASGPVVDKPAQDMTFGNYNNASDYMPSTTNTTWNYYSGIQEATEYQPGHGYHEESYERADMSTEPPQLHIQETKKDAKQKTGVEIVDLTMLD